MADPDKVQSETVDEDKVITRPGIILGWNAKGQFLVGFAAPWMDPAKANAYIDKAKEQLMKEMRPNIPAEQMVVGAGGIPSELLKTGGRSN